MTDAFGRFALDGRVALVTGGSRGLGKATARGLAQAGADIAIVSRNQTELDSALEEILDGTGRRGIAITADLSRRSDAERVAEEAMKGFGGVDILVNNAGANVPEEVDEITDAAWEHLLAVHVSSPMALARALVPGMKERRWGRLLYISSILAFQGLAGRHAYSTAKAALTGLARSNAVELGPHGITANCIAPGPFITDALQRFPDGINVAAERTAVGRCAEPDELVGPVLLLASDAGSFITGTTLVVDGGWLIK